MSAKKKPPIDVEELERLLRLSDLPDHAIADCGEDLPPDWDNTLMDAIPDMLKVVREARRLQVAMGQMMLDTPPAFDKALGRFRFQP